MESKSSDSLDDIIEIKIEEDYDLLKSMKSLDIEDAKMKIKERYNSKILVSIYKKSTIKINGYTNDKYCARRIQILIDDDDKVIEYYYG